MSKSRNAHKWYDDYDAENERDAERQRKKDIENRRRQKRMKNSLRTKNIDELMKYED